MFFFSDTSLLTHNQQMNFAYHAAKWQLHVDIILKPIFLKLIEHLLLVFEDLEAV